MFWSRRHGQRCGGFTLVEVLVAMTIVSVGILGLLGAMLMGSNASAMSSHLDDAVALANTKIEKAICVTSDKLQAAQGQAGRFTYALSFEDKSDGLMVATVTVKWLDGGSAQEYTLSKVFMPVSQSSGE